MKNRKFLSVTLAICFFVGVLLADLLTKGLIIPNLISNVGDTIDVIPGFINFIYVKNTGAAWGMLAGRPIFLIVVSIIVLGLLIAFYLLRIKKTGNHSSRLFGISMGLIAGGCIGNLFDRIVFGFVRDFINFQFFEFPVFNFADVALTIGMILLIVYFIFFYTKEDALLKAKDKEKTNQSSVGVDQEFYVDNIENHQQVDKKEDENEG